MDHLLERIVYLLSTHPQVQDLHYLKRELHFAETYLD